MKVIFLGVGEAFDENNPNNSHLILSSKTSLLLDCGFVVPYQLWKYNNNQSFLNGVYITHPHADHYFGLPALLVRMYEEKRKRRFTIICQKGFKKIIKAVLEYAYKGCVSNFKFKINFIEVEPGQNIKFNDLNLSFASGQHFVKDLAIKISNGKKTLCYSGDGIVTKQTEELYNNSDLLIHEAYLYDKPYIYDKKNHAAIVDLIKMAERNNIKCLALTHINRYVRKGLTKKKIFSKKVKVIIPKSLEEYKL